MRGNFNHNIRIDNLIIKFLAQQKTVGEVDKFQAWILQAENNVRYITEMHHSWNTAALNDKTPFDIEAVFQNFKARIGLQKTILKNSQHFNFSPSCSLPTALSLIIRLAKSGIYIFNSHLISSNKKLYSVIVPDKVKTKIDLSDKRVIWLNSTSTLTLKSSQKPFTDQKHQTIVVREDVHESAVWTRSKFFRTQTTNFYLLKINYIIYKQKHQMHIRKDTS